MRRRVVIIGRTTLAVRCLDAVLEAGDEVVLVVVDPSDSGVDGWQESLKGGAKRAGLPTATGSSVEINSSAFTNRLRDLKPDFLLSFQAAPILRPPLVSIAALASLNLHFGPLPRYRGVSPIAWALINGERATGVTLHHIDAGIDSGPIVASRRVVIRADDTGRSLYERCLVAGVRLFRSWWPRLRTGEIPSRPQDERRALYYNRYALDFHERRIRWNADVAAIYNRTRAFIFPPFQYPAIDVDGVELEIAQVGWDRCPHRARPGEIVSIADGTVSVGAPGGRLHLRDILRDGRRLDRPSLGGAGVAEGVRLQ